MNLKKKNYIENTFHVIFFKFILLSTEKDPFDNSIYPVPELIPCDVIFIFFNTSFIAIILSVVLAVSYAGFLYDNFSFIF